jgi:AAA+ superfamily predicted ATPase
LELLHNLLRVKILTNSILARKFGFSINELKIFKNLISNYLKGESSTEISGLVENLFNAKALETKLEYLQIINDLRFKGYLDVGIGGGHGLFMLDQMTQFSNREKTKHTPILELLHSSVAVSSKLLLLLEKGELESETDIKIAEPYSSPFEYIDDKFQKLKICADKSISSFEEAREKCNEIEKNIELRFQITKDMIIPLRDFLIEKQFSVKEEMIFLGVLGEEYSLFAGDTNFRTIEGLVNLISFKSYERFENRLLFHEDSRLATEKIFEFETSVQIIAPNQKSISNEELFIADEVMRKIDGGSIHSKRKGNLKEIVEKHEIFELVEPKKDLSAVVLQKDTRELLNTILKQLDKTISERLYKWGIKNREGIDARILFHGVPGTGKTLTASALAKSLNRDLLHFDCSKILSMYVGESEKNVRNIFDTYKKIVAESGVEPVLLLNEADQFLTSRSTDTSSSVSQMYNQMQNIFLEQIEKFEGVLIATTNLLENLDKAFSRRFNYKVEFKLPAKHERLIIWEQHLPKTANYEPNFSIEELAEYKLSGGQIDLIVKNTAYLVATRENPIFSTEDFLTEIKRERNSSFENNRVMGFLK